MNRKDLLVAGGAAAVLALGWYQFVWSSQGNSAAEAKKDVAAAEASVSKLNQQVTQLKKTEAELKEKADLAQEVATAIPAEADVSNLLKLLQTKAHDHKVTLTSLTNGQVTGSVTKAATDTSVAPVDTANEIQVTLAFHGAYTDVVSYIDELGTLPRLLVVDSVSLTPLGTSGSTTGTAVSTGDVSATVLTRAFTTAASESQKAAASTTVVTTAGASTATTTAKAAGAAATPVP